MYYIRDDRIRIQGTMVDGRLVFGSTSHIRLENDNFAIIFLYPACFPSRVVELNLGERLSTFSCCHHLISTCQPQVPPKPSSTSLGI